MSTIIRSTVTGSKPEKKLREMQTLFEIDSAQSDLEHLEPYGFTSEPFLDGHVHSKLIFRREILGRMPENRTLSAFE